MKRFIFIILFLVGKSAFGQIAKSPTELVPSGYIIFQEIKDDLNKDNEEDYIYIIKGTGKDKFIKDEYRGELDRNRRGIIIALKNNNQYEIVLKNLDCFSSENEDGGVYFAPELNISLDKGSLLIYYAHGRYGYWSYNFQYQNSDFELISYDRSESRGPITERLVSINLITKKMLVKENINQDAEGGDEKLQERWEKFKIIKPIKLSEVVDFDEFDAESLIAGSTGSE